MTDKGKRNGYGPGTDPDGGVVGEPGVSAEDALLHGDWQSMSYYEEGDRVTLSGVEYVFRNGRFVQIPKRSWIERWYGVMPFVIIILDIAGMSWLCIKYWEDIRPYFDVILTLNTIAVIFFTVFIMVGIEIYIEKKNQ